MIKEKWLHAGMHWDISPENGIEQCKINIDFITVAYSKEKSPCRFERKFFLCGNLLGVVLPVFKVSEGLSPSRLNEVLNDVQHDSMS